MSEPGRAGSLKEGVSTRVETGSIIEMNTCDFFWLAGLLEGEGCFSPYRTTPRITLRITDKDVACRAAKLMDSKVRVDSSNPSTRDIYEVYIGGIKAAILMAKLLPHMSERRQNRIQPVLALYRC